MSLLVQAVGRDELDAYPMPTRFRHEITYFMSIPGRDGVPLLGPDEYWIDQQAAQTWLQDGVFTLVSPLDSQSKTEIELSEEQEDWLQWLVTHGIEHVRLATS